ncbi:MAG: carbon-nitrogen hydrolase family protein [Actinomycetota bacterium]
MGETVRVAIAQVAPAFLDLEGSLARAEDAIAEAARGGARLVVFGETWLPGYPIWADRGLPWGDDVTKATHARLLANAVEVPGPATERLGRAAKSHGVHLVVGINERDARFSRGTLYNGLLTIDDAGRVLGVHRKLVPTHSERVIWGMGDGSTLHVFDTQLGRLGGLVCWEHWMPLARFAMHAQGEQIHVAAWPDVPEIHEVASRSYAFEARAFVLCAGQYLPLSAVASDLEIAPRLHELADADGVLLGGGSGVVGPDGAWLVGPVAGEAIVYADLDLATIAAEQQALDTAGHYHRPDVFTVRVDTTPRDPIAWGPEPDA